MPYLAYWIDDEGLLRQVGPFTPEERIVALDEKFCTSTQKVIDTILDIYKEKGIELQNKDKLKDK
jgi:hypothetical protein